MTAADPEKPQSISEQSPLGYHGQSVLINSGWLGTNLGLAIGEFYLKFVLKEALNLSAGAVSWFFFVGQFLNYIKPVAGVLTDSFPLLRTRRRAYLLISLTLTGIGWLLLGAVPREYGAMLVVYTLTYSNVVFTSTTLGGVMVEAGTRFRAEGRFTAQRIGMFKLGALIGAPLSGWMVKHVSFTVAASVAGAFHLFLVPLFASLMPEKPAARQNPSALRELKRQGVTLVHSRVLLAAAGMVFLIAIAPGLQTPLFFHQRNVLKFSPTDIGLLALIGNVCGFTAATFYHFVCRRMQLRYLIIASIVVHAAGTLFYYFYRDWNTAMLVAGLEGITETLAMLPVYDMAARCTPRGSEALGYSVMMSMWNLTNKLSDFIGSILYDNGVTFMSLIWLNSGTTLIALFAVPFLPAVLLRRMDGHVVEPPASEAPVGPTQP
jgi:predicted MFS family arabinose efflux permease